MIRKILPWVLLSFILLAVYVPTYTVSYAHHDSYAYLEHLPNSKPFFVFHDFLIFLGRYLGAWILTFYGWFVSDLSGLKVVNFLTLLQCICSACLVMRLLSRRYDPFKSLCITLMIFTLPPFQIMVSYTTATSHLTAVLFAIWAGVCAYRSNVFSDSRINISRIVLPVILLFLSLCIYSSNAMFYWAIVGLIIFLIEPESLFKVPQKIGVFLVGLTAIACYAVTVKTVNFFLRAYEFRNYSPVKINTDIIDRMQWFIREPLTNAVNLWNISPSNVANTFMYSLVLILVVFSGIRLMSGQNDRIEAIKRAGVLYFLASALIVLSFLPNLIALEKAPYYRCSAALTALVLVLFLGFSKLFLPVHFVRLTARPFLLVGALLSCGFCYHNVLNERVIPSYLEFDYLKTSIFSALDRHADNIHIIRPQWEANDGRYDEFRTPTSHWAEDILPMVITVLKEWGKQNGLKLVDMQLDYEKGVAAFVFLSKNKGVVSHSFGISSGLIGRAIPKKDNLAVINLDRFIRNSDIY